MWALVESGSVSTIYTRPKSLTIGDVNYPSNIFMLWTSSELEALNIYSVVVDNSNFKNPEYYTNTDQSFAFQSSVTINSIDYTNVVVASYGTATALNLATLKTARCSAIDQQAGSILKNTDWMVIRAAEGGTAVPSATTTWRAAVRTKANAIQVQIGNAANVDALAALYAYTYADPDDSTSAYTRPLGEFPVLGA